MKQIILSTLLALTVLSGCAVSSKTVTGKSVIIPESLQSPYEQFQYAPAVRAGNLVYLSGVVVTRRDNEAIKTSIERAFDEIELILAKTNADWSNVVDVTSYMTDLDTHIGPLWAVKGERVSAPYQAWTVIGIERLYGGDDAIIEIKVTAYLE